MTQYQKDFVRMADSIRKTNKGEMSCDGVECRDCPLHDVCASIRVGRRSLYVEDIMKAVYEWAKDHPVMTYEQKFKEDWGREPKSIGGIYLCPSYFGFEDCGTPFGQSISNPICIECEKKFWNSEYKPPQKEGE